MGNTLHAVTSGQGQSLANARFILPGGSAALSSTSSETTTRIAFPFKIAGTFSKLGVNCQSPAAGATMTLRKNIANGSETVSLGGAGWSEDLTHTDAVAVNDNFDLEYTSSGSATVICGARLIFVATTGHVAYYICSPTLSLNNNTRYYAPVGNGIDDTTEANSQLKARVAGTLANLVVSVVTNLSGTTTTFVNRLNGADGGGNLHVTFAGGATGFAVDASNSDTLADGDLFCVKASGDNSIVSITYLGMSFTATSGVTSDIWTTWDAAYAVTTATYLPIAGHVGTASTTETDSQIQFGFPAVLDKLRANVLTNSKTGTTTINLRGAAASLNNSLAIATGATGWAEDTTSTDSIIGTTAMNYMISGGTSGSLTIQAIGVRVKDNTSTGFFLPSDLAGMMQQLGGFVG